MVARIAAALSRLKRRVGQEAFDGAETVQLVMCLPIAFLTVFATIQLGMAGYSVVTTSAAVEQAAWEVDVAALADAQAHGDDETCRELIYDAIAKVAGGGASGTRSVLWAKNLTVTPYTGDVDGDESYWYTGDGYGTTSATTSVRNSREAWDSDGMMTEFGEVYTERTDGCVRFKVTYEIPSIANIDGLRGQVATKQVCRERVVENRMEVR